MQCPGAAGPSLGGLDPASLWSGSCWWCVGAVSPLKGSAGEPPHPRAGTIQRWLRGLAGSSRSVGMPRAGNCSCMQTSPGLSGHPAELSWVKKGAALSDPRACSQGMEQKQGSHWLLRWAGASLLTPAQCGMAPAGLGPSLSNPTLAWVLLFVCFVFTGL